MEHHDEEEEVGKPDDDIGSLPDSVSSENSLARSTDHADQDQGTGADLKLCCNYCSFTTRKTPAYIKHMNVFHMNCDTEDATGGKIRYRCGFCNYSSYAEEDLDEHLKSHTVKKPYHCSYCSYEAFTRSNVKGHWQRHHSDLPFICSEQEQPHLASKESSVERDLGESRVGALQKEIRSIQPYVNLGIDIIHWQVMQQTEDSDT